jgi:Polyketide synthase dehydratase
VDDVGRPISATRWPLVDAVVERNGFGSLTLTRALTTSSDPFLSQHLLNGRPTLPLTFGCELLAEAAQLACPGFAIASLLNVEVDVPVTLFGDRPLELRVRVALVERTSDQCVLDLRVTSDLRVGERVARDVRVHYTARASLSRKREPLRALSDSSQPAALDIAGSLHSRSFFHLLDGPIRLGPTFDRASWLTVLPNAVAGCVRPRSRHGLLERSAAPQFLIDPLGLDAALQIAASWDGFTHGWISAPIAIQRLDLGAPLPVSEAFQVQATVRSVEDDVVVYDCTGTGRDGSLTFQIEGLRQRRFARRNRSSDRKASSAGVLADSEHASPR